MIRPRHFTQQTTKRRTRSQDKVYHLQGTTAEQNRRDELGQRMLDMNQQIAKCSEIVNRKQGEERVRVMGSLASIEAG